MTVRDSPMAVRSAVREMDRVAEDPLADFWQAVRKAAELVLRVSGTLDSGSAGVQGRTLRSTPWRPGEPGELDLVTTVANVAARGGLVAGHDLRVLRRAPEQADYLILIDHSGSMVGRKLSLAAVLAAAVAQLSAAGRTRYGVLAFDEQVTSVKDLDAENDISEVVERILLLPEGKATDLARALQAAIEHYRRPARGTDHPDQRLHADPGHDRLQGTGRPGRAGAFAAHLLPRRPPAGHRAARIRRPG